MMRTEILKINLLLVLLSYNICQISFAADKNEHRQFSLIALDSVLTECKGEMHDYFKTLFTRNDSLIAELPLWEGKSFADISVAFSGTDLSLARNYEHRHTPMQQLESLSPSLIEKVWKVIESRTNITSAEQSNRNVVVNYLLHHLIALRFAHRASQKNSNGKEDLRLAFSYEAIALSYLIDAFSSAHILVDYKRFSGWQPFNYRKAHDFFRTKGMFVMNSRGEVWQTFGDGLMLWYEPTYRYALAACITSLRELLLIFYFTLDPDNLPERLSLFKNSLAEPTLINDWLEAKPGGDYYTVLKMPSLLCLPIPIAASWSKKSAMVDVHDIHRRIHFPQLSEPGFHDPDLEGIDPEFLLSKKSIPDWLICEELQANPHPDSARKIIKENKNFASVRYIQQRKYPPSISGFLYNTGGGAFFNNDFKPLFMIGFGFGFLDDLLFFRNLSADILYTSLFDQGNPRFITATVGAGIHVDLPIPAKFIKSFRFELGPAWEKGHRFDLGNHKIATGIDLPVLPLGFTYAGLTSRIMLQQIVTSSAWYGLYFQIVLH